MLRSWNVGALNCLATSIPVEGGFAVLIDVQAHRRVMHRGSQPGSPTFPTDLEAVDAAVAWVAQTFELH